ncbi:hypothetical protein VNO78_23352 [Psophocarpus tetragonolobus]|uniref:Uncharacterized protein n=1 Tax=Psophocarpus tetragonolobus TaxID=3891 RepID=A0AAN9S319_PSOTE
MLFHDERRVETVSSRATASELLLDWTACYEPATTSIDINRGNWLEREKNGEDVDKGKMRRLRLEGKGKSTLACQERVSTARESEK